MRVRQSKSKQAPAEQLAPAQPASPKHDLSRCECIPTRSTQHEQLLFTAGLLLVLLESCKYFTSLADLVVEIILALEYFAYQWENA